MMPAFWERPDWSGRPNLRDPGASPFWMRAPLLNDHREAMEYLASESKWRRGIEVGVGSGLLLERFLGLGIEMVAVDLGRREHRRARVAGIASDFAGLCRMLWLPSEEAAGHVPDGWADFVFIDAGHSYRAVRTDIAAWRGKVREGGWLGGHDYHSDHPGVIRAVDEAFGDAVELLPHWIWRAATC